MSASEVQPPRAGAWWWGVLLDLGYLVLFLLLVPWLLFLILGQKRGVGSLAQRLGATPLTPPDRPRIWLHATSVGELEASLPLLGALRSSAQGTETVISTTTTTAQGLARQKCPKYPTFLFPLDFGFAVRRALRRIRPSLLVLVELEIWPNLILHAARRGVPVVVVNGRVSERGFRRMLRARWILRPFLRQVTLFLVQNEEVRSRLEALGVEPARLEITGNLKLDKPPLAEPEEIRRRFEERWGYPPRGLRWIAGCTHPGEEEKILRIHRELKERFPGLTLIIAPRHVERAGDVLRLVEQEGLEGRRLEAGPAAAPDVIVVDTVGQLVSLYACADLAFVGGSLVPRGGHNVLEPLLAGTPVLYGPYTSNFREIVGLLEGAGAAKAREATELEATVGEWLADPSLRRSRLEAGLAVLAEHRGGAERVARRIAGLLPPNPSQFGDSALGSASSSP